MGYQLTWFNKTYLWVLLGLWSCIGVVALIDNIIHRNELPAGWQLHRAISAILIIFLVQQVSTAVFDGSDAMYSYLIVIYNVAESAFLGLLLLIAIGWKITRDSTKGRRLLFAFPPIHCICSLIVDFILDRRVGHKNADLEVAYIPDDTERGILILANLVSLVTLLYAWWWIFVCSSAERKDLQARIDARAAGTLSDSDSEDDEDGHHSTTENADGETFARIDLDTDDNDDEEEVFDARSAYTPGSHLSPRGDSLSEPESAVGDTISDTTATDSHRRQRRNRRRGRGDPQLAQQLLPDSHERSDVASPSTADFGIPDKAKLRLLNQYNIMVQLYLFTYLLILLVIAWRQDRPPAAIVILELCNMLILAGMLYVFRLRATNPYYILPETLNDEEYGSGYTGGTGDEPYGTPEMHTIAEPMDPVTSNIGINDGNAQFTAENSAFEIGSDSDDETGA